MWSGLLTCKLPVCQTVASKIMDDEQKLQVHLLAAGLLQEAAGIACSFHRLSVIVGSDPFTHPRLPPLPPSFPPPSLLCLSFS